jgi:DNA-binding CsgD family transcriptional regulator
MLGRGLSNKAIAEGLGISPELMLHAQELLEVKPRMD